MRKARRSVGCVNSTDHIIRKGELFNARFSAPLLPSGAECQSCYRKRMEVTI